MPSFGQDVRRTYIFKGLHSSWTGKPRMHLLGWTAINERLLYACLNSRFAKVSIVVCYVPIEGAEEDAKDDFYDSLQTAIEGIPKHDILLLLGDFNAKVGSDNDNRENVMGRHGVGAMNDNGERLICDFCESNCLAVGGTLFQHENIHKLTWKSPDGSMESQIDHIIIN